MSNHIYYEDLVKISKLLREGTEFNGYQSIWECPGCFAKKKAEKRGGNVKPTLYVNVKLKKGLCQRCGLTVHRKSKPTVEELCQDFLEEKEAVTAEPKYNKWEIESWTTPIDLNKEAGKYLLSRGFSEEVINTFGFRYCSKPYSGIVIPNNPGKFTNFFQIRSLNPNAKLRYLNPTGDKPVYGDFRTNFKEAIVCEGPLSAASTYSRDWASYGLYGKSASISQIRKLKELPIELYHICLDATEGFAILRLAEQLLSIREEVGLILFKEGDPNDNIKFFEQWKNTSVTINKTSLKYLLVKMNFSKEEKVKLDDKRWLEFIKLVRKLRG